LRSIVIKSTREWKKEKHIVGKLVEQLERCGEGKLKTLQSGESTTGRGKFMVGGNYREKNGGKEWKGGNRKGWGRSGGEEGKPADQSRRCH